MGSSFFGRMTDTVLAIATLTLLVSCGSSAPFKQTNLDVVMEDMERRAHLVNQFQAQFVKKRSGPLFDRELTVNGRLVFQKPAKMWLTLTGDINVEILTDGRHIKVVHDNTDEETFNVRGDRDMSKFADPLLLLINSVGNGGLRNLAIVKDVQDHDSRMVEIDPTNELTFERIQRVFLWLSQDGEIRRVRILFRDGGTDDTVFKSWSLLSADAQEIRKLNEKLRSVAIKPGLGVRGDGDSPAHSLAKENPLSESFAPGKPVSVNEVGRLNNRGSLTRP